jgi:hypothetical protein
VISLVMASTIKLEFVGSRTNAGDSMSKIFYWKPTDSVDVGLIDRQHKELLEIAEELY